jgi:hypothetical protein
MASFELWSTVASVGTFLVIAATAVVKDVEFRHTLGIATNKAARPMIFVGNYYEEIGIFVKYGLVDKNIACEMWSNEIVTDWNRMAPAIAIMQQRGSSYGWQNFEYMFTLCEAWQKRYPEGKFPKDRRRVFLEQASHVDDD